MAANCYRYTIECINKYVKGSHGSLTQDEHLIDGVKISKNGSAIFYLYAPLIIKVKGGSVTIIDRMNREFTLGINDTKYNTIFALKTFLATCNCLCDDNQVTGGDLKIIENTAHTFVMPVQGFITVTFKAGVWAVANTTTADFLHEMYIVEIIDADTFVVQQNGFITVPAHGLTVSEYYYLTDVDYVLSLTPDTEFDDVVVFVIDDGCLMLIDNRPIDLTVDAEGVQLPLLTTVERDAIVTPLTGKMIYNITTDQVEHVNNALAWVAT